MSIIKHKSVIAGRGTLYNGNINIYAGPNGINIGNFCAIGPGLTLMNINHDYNYPAMQYTFYKKYFRKNHPGIRTQNKNYSKGKITIGNDVWFGDKVSVMSGVTIGDGCVIGLGSVVTKDLEPYTICAGIPCKKIKYRFSKEIIEYLLELKWWNWSDDKIKRNSDFFASSLENISLDELKNIVKE